MLVKRVINPAKKRNIKGNIFHLLFLGTDAVLYDSLWDEAIIYGNKNLVRITITDPRKLVTLLDKQTTEITLYIYSLMENGELKRVGNVLKGIPSKLMIPNY